MTGVVEPGSTIGMMGGGQLGRMFALEARKLGYRIITLCPEADCPAAPVSDQVIAGEYEDPSSLKEFGSLVDVVTYEFENISVEKLDVLEKLVPIFPRPEVLHVSQNRYREKSRLKQLGLPTAPWAHVQSAEELIHSLEEFGGEAILKSVAWGYDGKGQYRITSSQQARELWSSLGWSEGVLEDLVDFQYELSVIGVRTHGNRFTTLGPFLNHHANHILDVTLAGAGVVPEAVAQTALEIARGVTEGLDVIGVICIEMFLTQGGDILINEVAPRPHNSGHLTIDSCLCSQFEQHVRAVCGLPLGSSEFLRSAAMANLLGDLWPKSGLPPWERALAHPEVKLHLYGKTVAKPGRKMGHLTALAQSPQQAEQIVRQAREEIRCPQ